MERIISIFKRNWTYLAGAIAGGVTGYLYWYFIGCESGTCPITASPLRSALWGAVIGSLLFSLFKKDSKNEQDNK
ncbi:MAG: DUF6132 family protein [Dysgonomonas sp.]